MAMGILGTWCNIQEKGWGMNAGAHLGVGLQEFKCS